MAIPRRCYLSIALLFAAATLASAQTLPSCTPGIQYTIVLGPGPGTTPLTAVNKVSTYRKLADGNIIQTTARVRQARTSTGLTYREELKACRVSPDGQTTPEYGVSIFDPATRITTSWGIGPGEPKLVRVRHFPASAQESQKFNPSIPQVYPNRRTETLGTRNILGVVATGVRMIVTMPAGLEGNTLPIEVVTETWTAKNPKLQLINIIDDPRSGRYSDEVEELTLQEPDPALFKPPADYKVEDHTDVTTTPNSTP